MFSRDFLQYLLVGKSGRFKNRVELCLLIPLVQWLAQFHYFLEVHFYSFEREKLVEQANVGVDLLHKCLSFVLIYFFIHFFVVELAHFCLEGREHLCGCFVLEEEEVCEDQEDLAVDLCPFLKEGFKVAANYCPGFLAHVVGENLGNQGDSIGALVLREVFAILPHWQ